MNEGESECYGRCSTGDPAHIDPHLKSCDCANWQALSGGAQESMNAEQFAEQVYSLLLLGGCANLPNTFVAVLAERVEAYASERVAQLEKQRDELQAWKESAMSQLAKSDKLKELLPSKYWGWDVYDASADYMKQVEGLRAALRQIADLEIREFREPMDYVRYVDKIAKDALATQLPTKH